MPGKGAPGQRAANEGVRITGAWIRRGGGRGLVPAAVAVLAALGALAGILVTVLGGAPRTGLNQDAATRPPAGRAAGGAPAVAGLPLTLSASAQLLPGAVPAVATTPAKQDTVAPLRRSVQADLIVVAPSALPGGLLARVNKLPGMVQAESIEAFRIPVNGTETAVVGVDPSQFRSFAAHPTGAATALWQGVADGGVAVSYEMGKLGQIPLGGSVLAAGRTSEKLPVVAFGTLGIGGVNAVVSDATARALGAPAGNALVVSVRVADFTADEAALGRLVPAGAAVQPLVSLVIHHTVTSTGTASSGTPASTTTTTTTTDTDTAGAGSVSAPGASGPVIQKMLAVAALSRVGMPYVYGAAGPSAFDCSGLVQWSFAQAGISLPRVAADQAQAGRRPSRGRQPGRGRR